MHPCFSQAEGSVAHRLHEEYAVLHPRSPGASAAGVTPHPSDLVPAIKFLLVHRVEEFFSQLRATVDIMQSVGGKLG